MRTSRSLMCARRAWTIGLGAAAMLIGLCGVQCALSLDGFSGGSTGDASSPLDARADVATTRDDATTRADAAADDAGAEAGPRPPTNNIQVWLKADSLTTAGPVPLWSDSTGAGHNAKQASALLQPEFVPSGPGSRAVVRFDGIDDELDVSYMRPQNDFSFFFVVAAAQPHEIDPESTTTTTGTTGQHYLFDPTNSGTVNSGAGLSLGTNGMSVYEHAESYMPPLAVFDGPLGTQLFLGELVYEAKAPRLYVNGNLVRQGPTSPRAAVIAPRSIGAGNSGYGACQVDVAEIIVYSVAVSDADRSAVEQYVRSRYGL